MRIAVAGGTGQVGAHVVAAARARGHDVVVLARSTGVDLVTGAGVAAALAGADAVLDVVSVTTLGAAESIAFFEGTTRTLLAAEAEAGVGHHLALSIVGIERAPEGYYAGKLAQERLVEAGATPWTILRATQFHEFARQIYARARIGPFHVAPKMRTQPIAAREVGGHLVTLAEAGPAGRSRDLAGPREESLVEMVRGYARARGSRAWIPAIPLPGASGRAQRDGSLLPNPDALLGTQTYADWLAALPARTAERASASAPASGAGSS
ncbi:SDR family oxidoreductase [Microbacterium sp.]|uniref:SDR family oxidoreductase n=1 Tax=Microbacterium sp. TaxID=51671 RepID=UPI002E2F53FE|nr:SDR family oxidoreductase [Microbacterium sp.]HEX5730010.1 SDR family oxidoreductase [Microbacterium sp.]